MSSTFDAPENIEIGEYAEDKVAIDLEGNGIDLQDLRAEKDVQFEVNPDSMEHEEIQRMYFDNEDLFKQLNYECLDDGDADDNLTPFTRLAREMTDLTANKDGGVLKCVLKHGAGVVVPTNALCRVHYNAYYEYGPEPFDSSYIRNRQKSFKLGSGEVLAGWEVGVPTMKRGETARFLIAPDYAYGKLGCPPRIPENATILFEIQLISFVDQEAADSFDNISEEDRKQITFSELLKVIDSLRLTGNEAFQINQISRALGKYSQALRLLENARLQNESEEVQMKKLSLKLYLNLSLCELKGAKHGRACRYARKALDIDSKNVRALYRLAQALRNMAEYKEAKKHIYRASQLDPRNKDIMAELNKLNEEMERHKKKDEAMCKRMFNMEVKQKIVDEKPKPSPVSQMADMMMKMLKQYESDPEQKQEIPLPGNLTPNEISCIKECAQELNLYMYERNEGNVKSYRVAKK